jgi:hypothetical protein
MRESNRSAWFLNQPSLLAVAAGARVGPRGWLINVGAVHAGLGGRREPCRGATAHVHAFKHTPVRATLRHGRHAQAYLRVGRTPPHHDRRRRFSLTRSTHREPIVRILIPQFNERASQRDRLRCEHIIHCSVVTPLCLRAITLAHKSAPCDLPPPPARPLRRPSNRKRLRVCTFTCTGNSPSSY